MGLKNEKDSLTQVNKVGSSIACQCCDYLEVVFDTPVSSPTVTITGVTQTGLVVVLHTEATITANKRVSLSNAGAYVAVYATIGTVASDTCIVGLTAVWLGRI